MTMTVETKRAGSVRLVTVDRPKQAPAVVATLVGTEAAPANAALLQAAAATSEFATRAHEISTSMHGPAIRGDLLRQASGATLPRLEKAAIEIAKVRDGVATRVAQASGVKPWAAGPAWQPQVDLAMAAAFNALSPAERAQAMHAAQFAPWDRLELAEALTRVPGELAKVSAQERRNLQVATFAFFNRDEFHSLHAQIEQSNSTVDGMRRIADAAVELGASRADISLHAPSWATLIAQRPLSWGCDPRVIDTFGGGV